MDDNRIIELYWQRSEDAIHQTSRKYGKYCYRIADNILADRQDSEECVNDTYLSAWNTIPPHRPGHLRAFLGRITRNLALNRHKQNTAKKRGGGQVELVFEELRDCIPGQAVDHTEDLVITDTLNRFLGALPARTRRIFLLRYWYFSSVAEIAKEFDMSESNVKVLMYRTRQELRCLLEKEGIYL